MVFGITKDRMEIWMSNKNSGLGIGAIIVIVLGALFATGTIGGGSGMISSILHFAGIACITIGIIVVLLVALVIFAAFKTKPKNDNQDTKMEINQIIDSRQKELAKLKSTLSITKMELRKAQTKLHDSKSETEKRNYEEICANYESVIAESEKKILEMDADILLMKQRRDNAFSKINEADYLLNEETKLEELEEKAQYEQDYAEAYKSLK